MATISYQFTVIDRKGARSVIQLNTGDGDVQTFTGLTQVAEAAIPVISDLITGRIERVSATINLDLGDPDTTAAIDSDVEEGARFVMRTEGGFTTSVRLPTFDENFIQETSRQVDFAAAPVIAFTDLLTQGVALTTPLSGTALFRDTRGAAIEFVTSALEAFQKSRR